MSLLRRPKDGSENWTFGGRKHEGETVEQVATNDPGYIRWAWKEATCLDDPAYYQYLEEVADSFGIDLQVEKSNIKFRKGPHISTQKKGNR
jgi:hypothetical protein